MFGYPISQDIQETLNERKASLKRNENPYKLTKGKNPSKEIQKNFVRTPYISMLSSPKLIHDTGQMYNQFDEGDVIISNQEYNRSDENVDFNPINYGFELYSDVQKQGGKYKYEPDKKIVGYDEKGKKITADKYQSKFKPQPGIISLTSEYESSNNVQFVRRVSINWRCHHLDDLERLSYRFLTYNKLVYVEWGWNYADKPATSFITPENLKIIKNPTTLRKQVIEKGKGNFDAVLGVIDKFEWSSTGGGFECKTDIVAHGVDILNQRINNDNTKIEAVSNRTGINIPRIYETPEEEDSSQSIIEEYEKLIKKREGTYRQRLEYQKKFPGATKAPVFLTDTEQQRILQIESAFGGSGIPDLMTPEVSGVNTTVTNEGDGVNSIEAKDYDLVFEETFKQALENLPRLINNKLDNTEEKEIATFFQKSRKSQVEQQLKELRNKKQNEINDLLKIVQEEYDNNNFQDWELGVQDYTRDNAILIEVNRRFQKTYSLDAFEKKNKIKDDTLDAIVKRERNKYKLKPEDDYDLTTRSSIKHTKNFIQQKNKEEWYKDEYIEGFQGNSGNALSPDRVVKHAFDSEQILAEKTWIRWGWFEDNILNRFFGLVNGSGDTILKIRSVRDAVDDNGVVILEDGKPKKVQEKITNHPKFLTPDINRFIFPGKFKVGSSSDSEEEYSYFRSRVNLLKSENYEKTEEFQNATLWQKKDNLGEVIDTQIVFNQDLADEENITDDLLEYKANIDENEIKKELNSYKILKELESIVQDEESIDSFNVEGEEHQGILRNVFINVKHLQNIFNVKTTLGNCLSSLSESLNTTSSIINIIAQVNATQDEGHIVFTDRRFLTDFKPVKKKVYEFPVKITESFVKATNLQSDANSEVQKILLSKNYSKMQDIYTTENLYGSRGQSVDAQSDWDSMGQRGIPKNDPKKINLPGVPPFIYSQIQRGSVGTFGEIDGDFRNELSFSSKNFNFGLNTKDANKAINEKIKKRQQYEKTTETETKYAINFPGNYTKEGILKSKPSKDNITGLVSLERRSPYEEFGLLFLTNTISIDGIAGIFPSNIYTSQYLPDKFYDNAFFYVENLTQNVDSSTWTTEITGRVLFKHKITSGNMTVEDEITSGDDDE
tara:strand:+ start:107 stop:3466 length:3360 start_codon:yes stop_codon:yes gene_type:complete